MVKRAEQAGYQRLVVTKDAPLHGIHNRAQRAGFELPEGVEAINLKDRAPLPRKVLIPEQSIVLQGMMSEVPLWDDIAWLQQNTTLPIVLKGLLHVDDVLHAQKMGIDAVVVSKIC